MTRSRVAAAVRRIAPGVRAPVLVIPSRPPIPRSRIRLLALLAVRDEMRFLPGLIANLSPHVDGIVAYDDGSTDGSGEFLARQPVVLEVVAGERGRRAWDEPGNHRRLVEAAGRHRPDWLLSIDADERVERSFRARAERVVSVASVLGFSAVSVRIRDLWDDPGLYRSDGVWGRKHADRLFRARADHAFDPRPLHGFKAPAQALRLFGRLPLADLDVYHLRMLRREAREARRRRYEALDPEGRLQPEQGYAYLTDTRGLRLTPVPRGRGYEH